MKIGVSTSCFYPQTTEETLERIAALGFEQIEVFVNAPSESTPQYARQFRKAASSRGLEVIAFHPFTSFSETFCLFGTYERRRLDYYDIYESYFDATAQMGAKIFQFHGCRSDYEINCKAYCEIYHQLYTRAQKYGIAFSQENVNKHHAASPDFIKEMKRELGDDVCFTFDIKQAKRSGFDPCVIRDSMGDKLIHLHASDYLQDGSCALPGKGMCCYPDVINDHLRSQAVTKVIEVYSQDFTQDSELLDAVDFMNKL